MAQKDPVIEKIAFDGKKVEILGETYEAGQPTRLEPDNWRNKLIDRKTHLRFLETGLRYWYASEGFGSEKRKNPA